VDIHACMDNWRLTSKNHGYPCWYPSIFGNPCMDLLWILGPGMLYFFTVQFLSYNVIYFFAGHPLILLASRNLISLTESLPFFSVPIKEIYHKRNNRVESQISKRKTHHGFVDDDAWLVSLESPLERLHINNCLSAVQNSSRHLTPENPKNELLTSELKRRAPI